MVGTITSPIYHHRIKSSSQCCVSILQVLIIVPHNSAVYHHTISQYHDMSSNNQHRSTFPYLPASFPSSYCFKAELPMPQKLECLHSSRLIFNSHQKKAGRIHLHVLGPQIEKYHLSGQTFKKKTRLCHMFYCLADSSSCE